MTARERRKAMLEVLCLRGHDTRANLAFEFGVSRRTIEYDVQILSLEYPIYTQQGKGGGIYVSNGFRLIQKSLTCKQTQLLRKICDALTGEEKQTLQEIIDRFGISKGGRNI